MASQAAVAPSSQAPSAPPSPSVLSDRVVRKFQRGKPLKFPLNEEATSLSLDPAGRFVCAGFTDGTVRLFDLTGYFRNTNASTSTKMKVTNAPGGSPMPTTTMGRHKTASSSVVDSKRHLKYGAVACQIHAKGVHTSLRMHVEMCSDDGLWCFAGALRGSMELLAIQLHDLQQEYVQLSKKGPQEQVQQQQQDVQLQEDTTSTTAPNMLDHLTIYRHADAKLRGFGACTRLRNSSRYLLFTGKAIKNIHIWSFDPPRTPDEDPVLTQLYDTSTNGITINFLQFRRHGTTGALQAISKSNDQRLRVWDLSAEEEGKYNDDKDDDPTMASSSTCRRPSRPPFKDVPNTEGTLAVSGGLCICGGSNMYNQMSLVSLNVDNLQSPYNHTELALPGVTSSSTLPTFSRRAQRGDLKSVVAAYGSILDATSLSSLASPGQHQQNHHVLLEISDGTLAQYHQEQQCAGQPRLTVNDTLPWYANTARTMAVGNIPGTCPVAVVAMYQAGGIGKGQLSVWPLEKPTCTTRAATAATARTAIVTKTPSFKKNKTTEETSIASTATMTPESLVSRRDFEKSTISAEKQAAEQKDSKLVTGADATAVCDETRGNVTDTSPTVTTSTTTAQTPDSHDDSGPKNDKKPVLRLVLRLPGKSSSSSSSVASKQPAVSPVVTTTESTPTRKLRDWGTSPSMNWPDEPKTIESFESTKSDLFKAHIAPPPSIKKKRRLSMVESSVASSKKAPRRFSNDRFHSAPALLESREMPLPTNPPLEMKHSSRDVEPGSGTQNIGKGKQPQKFSLLKLINTSTTVDTKGNGDRLPSQVSSKDAVGKNQNIKQDPTDLGKVGEQDNTKVKMALSHKCFRQPKEPTKMPAVNKSPPALTGRAEPPSIPQKTLPTNSIEAKEKQTPPFRVTAQNVAQRCGANALPTVAKPSQVTDSKQRTISRTSSPTVSQKQDILPKRAESLTVVPRYSYRRSPVANPNESAAPRTSPPTIASHLKASSRSSSPQMTQAITQDSVRTAPKTSNQRCLVTPTPNIKASVSQADTTWDHLSLGDVAKTLSSLKKSPSESARTMVDTPMLKRCPENTKPFKQGVDSAEKTFNESLATEVDPLPAPRVLHGASKKLTGAPTKNSSSDSSEGRLKTISSKSSAFSPSDSSLKQAIQTPTTSNLKKKEQIFTTTSAAKSKRKGSPTLEENQAVVVVEKHDTSAVPPAVKRRKTTTETAAVDASFDWLRPVATLRGRRNDEGVRKAIAKECKRQRIAIERKVETLCSTSSLSSSLSSLGMGRQNHNLIVDKAQAEHQAAFLFLEKRVWRSVRSLLQSIERAPSVSALHESRLLLQQLVEDYRNTAIRLLHLHGMERMALPHSSSDASRRHAFDMAMFDKILECFPRVV